MRRSAHPKRFIRTIALSLVVSGGLAAALASSPALASTPDIETFAISETGVDPGASAAWGFTVSSACRARAHFRCCSIRPAIPRAFWSTRT
jgi:glycerol uptake facilitator-like aquaporin